MATPPEQPWTNHEKNYLLAEIVKASNPHPDVLLGVIRNLNVKPRWDDIPLPLGRSLNSCKMAYDELWRSLPMQPMRMPHTPTQLSAPVQPLKRPFQFDGSYSAGASNREIRPRPAVIGGGGGAYPQPSPTEPPPKRKRGRPTKAEAQAKAEAAAATTGDPGSATTSRSATQTAATLPPPTMAATMRAEEAKPSTTVTTRMPIAAMLTPNPRESKSASHSGSSSGKRRRARSNREEAEELAMSRGGERDTIRYESPYARIDPRADDSPARTAVLRHREEYPIPPPTSSPQPGGAITTQAAMYPHGHPRPR